MAQTLTKVISITSGKGGVGKTHTSVNLGLALVRKGKKVLLLDADLGLANINILLGFRPAATLQQVFEGKAKLSDIIVSHKLGFDIIPAASGVTEMIRLSKEKRLALISAVEELGTDYDYMLIDTAAGIGDSVIHFNVSAEEVLVVVDKEPTSVTDAYALIKVLAKEHGVKNFNIIANRTPLGTDGRATYANLAKATDRFLNVGLNYLGSIADDSCVSEAVIEQTPYLKRFPNSRASRDVTRLAEAIISLPRKENVNGGLQFFFQDLLTEQVSN